MKLVFFGTPPTAVPSLNALVQAGHEVGLVVTQPDRPVGRSRRPSAPPVKVAALEHRLEVFQPTKVRNETFRQTVAAHEPELLIVVAYGRILPGPVLRIAPRGAVNLHFSLLPAYRGAAPVQWALVNGDTVTGVTTMQVNEKMDEGDLLLQREVAIEEGEHAPALQERLAAIGTQLLVETVDRLEKGTLQARPQDHEKATLAPLLSKGDGEIDPQLTARDIEGRLRGFDPWPGVWVQRGGKGLRIVEARALGGPQRHEPAGSVTELTAEGLIVACGGGTTLLVSRVQPEGRKVLSAREAVNGRQLQVGDRLEKKQTPP